MITYEKILKRPEAVHSLIGMSLEDFEKLLAEFECVHTAGLGALPYTLRDHGKRCRAVGAGPKHKYALCDRLLMTLFWLRACTTYEVLGTLYHMNKTTIEENLKSIMHTLSLMNGFHFERPQPEVPKLRSIQEVINTFPDMLLFMDPEEQSME